MRIFYLLMFTLGLLSTSHAQTSCIQNHNGSWGGYEIPIAGETNWVAFDVDVESYTTFTIESMDLTVITDEFPGIFEFTVNIFDTNLENILESVTLNLTGFGTTIPGVWDLSTDLSEPVTLEANSSSDQKYWVAIQAASPGNETASLRASTYIPGDNLPAYYSTDNGQTWSSEIDGISEPVELVIKLIGQCGEIELPECSQNYGGGGGFEIPIAGGDNWAAFDVVAEAYTEFTIQSFEFHVVTDSFPGIFGYTLQLYDENFENVIASSTLMLTEFSATIPGIWNLSADLDNPLVLTGGVVDKKYWVAIQGDTNGEPLGLRASAYNSGDDLPAYHSSDNGQTWSSEIDGVSIPLEADVKVIGVCVEIEVEDPECSQGIAAVVESGTQITNSLLVASVDVIVEPNQDFEMHQFEFDILAYPNSTVSKADVTISLNNNGLPGEEIQTQIDLSPVSEVYVSEAPTFPGREIRRVTLELDPVMLEGRLGETTYYWVSLNIETSDGSDAWWGTTSAQILGNPIVTHHIPTGTWTRDWGSDGIYELRGECFDHEIDVTCDATFYDTGGANGDYGNNENEIWNIIPDNGMMASVEFTSFATEEGFDGLMVYDGPDTTYPIISSGFTSGNETCPNGAWTGSGQYSAEGRTFISTHSSGILTFAFTSDSSGTDSGWEANITCVEPGSAGNCLPGTSEYLGNWTTSSGSGYMFNITSLSDEAFEIQKFGAQLSANGKIKVNVYYRLGGFEGYEQIPSEWTLLGSQITVVNDWGNPVDIRIGGLEVEPSETYGIYLAITEQISNSGIKFRYDHLDDSTYTDDTLEIPAGTTMWNPDFGDILNQNISWRGIIYYCKGGEDPQYEEPCLVAEYGQYPLYDYTPGCFGYTEAITESGWRGEYSVVNVTSDVEYTFSSSVSTDLITISDSLGVVSIVSGEGEVTWTADFDGAVRFYTHTDDSCGHNNSEPITRFVQCGELYVPQEPDFDCFFGDGLESNLENGLSIQDGGFYRAADDFVVEHQMWVQQIRLNVVSSGPVEEGRFIFYENVQAGGLNGPGSLPLLETDMLQPTEAIELAILGENRVVYELTFDLPNELLFEEGRYWMSPSMNGGDTGWEITSTGSYGDYVHAGEIEWIPQEGMQGVFFISGECDDLGVEEWNNYSFSYHPNPVSDKLTINSNQKIETFNVYSISGSLIVSVDKPMENSFDLSFLTTGVYIVKVVMENGAIEPIKIIKN